MESRLLGPDGKPLHFKKAAPPKLGEAFGPRFNDGLNVIHTLPGGGIIQFDLSRLTLADFRLMRDHYQVNASLSVLTFMMHQLDWKIVCDNERIRKHCQENMDRIWTRLVRALGQAFWAGYSPSILQWENDLAGKTVQLTKVKDLRPEECQVNWKLVDGWAPGKHSKPRLRVYDGIKQYDLAWPIPSENTLWYPLLMENGDWYGRKLLRPAFTPWFFSILVHLFSNRYFERFGEPLPVGRAPYDDELDINGRKVTGRDVMLGLLQNLRSRGAVVLPAERSIVGNETQYDYDIEYLESQMRGADFERYLMRLDEEISLALFTPLLMLRTADVGSYNLGSQHSAVYMQMLNALAGDWKEYIDKFVLSRMVDFNFSPTSPRATIQFRKLGDDKSEMVKALLQQLFAGGKVMPDLQQMGDIAGLTLTEVEEITSEETEPTSAPGEGDDSNEESGERSADGGSTTASAQRAVEAIYARLDAQVRKAFREGTFGAGFVPSLGYQRQFQDGLKARGASHEDAAAAYASMSSWVDDLTAAGPSAFSDASSVLAIIKRGLENAVGGGNASAQ